MNLRCRLTSWLTIPRYNLGKLVKTEVEAADLTKRTESAEQHPAELIKTLRYTEHQVEWVLLYDHARAGQIAPDVIRRMRRDDLEYLAGMQFPHPDWLDTTDPATGRQLGDDEVQRRRGMLTKLQGNVARASRELDRRNSIRTGALAATVGAVLGALIALLA